MINYLLLLSSISMETIKNALLNSFSKNSLKNETDIYKFNFFTYVMSFVVMLFFGKWELSSFTVFIAFIFALILTVNQYVFMKALKCGPLAFTNFIQSSSLIIPTIVGVLIWNDAITVLQAVMILVVIVSMAFALGIKKDGINVKWIVFSSLSMITCGGVGIVQTIQQTSDVSNEFFSFLRMAFLFTFLMNLTLWLFYKKRIASTYSMKSDAIIKAGVSGAFLSGVHMINLHLVGVMPKVIFFPVVNGGLIFLTLICAVVLFKEKLTIKQWVGILIGTVALCLIGI